MDDDELADALSALGSSDVPEPRRAFADALEDRLRTLHGGADIVGAPPIPWTRRALVAAAAVSIVVVALGAILAQRGREPTTRLTAATDTSLVLPDGSVVVAESGADLPEGALVITGPQGSAVVDGVPIPENSQAVIRDGSAVPVSTTASSGAPPPTATTAPPATRPDTPPTKPSTTTTTARSEPARMELQARREPLQAVALRWSMYQEPDFKRYALVRTARSGDKGEATTIVFSTEDRGVHTFRDQLPVGVDHAGYRVLAIDEAGRVIGASPLAHV